MGQETSSSAGSYITRVHHIIAIIFRFLLVRNDGLDQPVSVGNTVVKRRPSSRSEAAEDASLIVIIVCLSALVLTTTDNNIAGDEERAPSHHNGGKDSENIAARIAATTKI